MNPNGKTKSFLTIITVLLTTAGTVSARRKLFGSQIGGIRETRQMPEPLDCQRHLHDGGDNRTVADSTSLQELIDGKGHFRYVIDMSKLD
ncbi:MAG: hypothetical protein LUE26_10590 [Alistipes sp.]|nr:hypothetical protein [Alistipes sp.]